MTGGAGTPFIETGEMDSQRLLLASIHDVSPRFESEVDRLVDLLRPHVGDRLAMLVVPNHWGNALFIAGSAFATRIRGWAERGFEMFLHGFFHRDDQRHMDAADRFRARHLTSGEGGFSDLRGMKCPTASRPGTLIEDVIGRPSAASSRPPGSMATAHSKPCARSEWRSRRIISGSGPR